MKLKHTKKMNWKNGLLILSGILLIFMSILILIKYKLDPIDQNLIIHEQAINLTS